MKEYLMLKLQGPMQAWGDHTFEGLRPISIIPTRSGIIGLLAACLGIERRDKPALSGLNKSLGIGVRMDTKRLNDRDLESRIAVDFHTIKDARDGYRGLKSHATIVTQREYLFDGAFSVALWEKARGYPLDEIEAALKAPRFTPFLGRKSCPLGRPLFETRVTADHDIEALRNLSGKGGEIYSETDLDGSEKPIRRIQFRDVPTFQGARQFSTRTVYVYPKED